MSNEQDSELQATDQPFRLCFRHEGSMINCYIAPPDTMEGAILMSCMPKRVLDADRTIWEDWRALMKRVIVVICREVLETEPLEMIERPAPESERSGHS